MRRTLLSAASLIALTSIAAAQPVSVDQITPAASRHLADVEQVPSSRIEKRGAAMSSQPSTPAGAAGSSAGLPPRAASRSSIDADEIARLLSTGRAGSIDAAAAVATGALDAPKEAAAQPPEEPNADDAKIDSGVVSQPRERR